MRQYAKVRRSGNGAVPAAAAKGSFQDGPFARQAVDQAQQLLANPRLNAGLREFIPGILLLELKRIEMGLDTGEGCI